MGWDLDTRSFVAGRKFAVVKIYSTQRFNDSFIYNYEGLRTVGPIRLSTDWGHILCRRLRQIKLICYFCVHLKVRCCKNLAQNDFILLMIAQGVDWSWFWKILWHFFDGCPAWQRTKVAQIVPIHKYAVSRTQVNSPPRFYSADTDGNDGTAEATVASAWF